MIFYQKETEKNELVVRPGMYNMEVLVSTSRGLRGEGWMAEALQHKGCYVRTRYSANTTKYETAFTV